MTIDKGNQLPSFWKEGCPTGGVVGKEWFDLLYKVVCLPTTSPFGYSSFQKEES